MMGSCERGRDQRREGGQGKERAGEMGEEVVRERERR